MVLDHDDDGPLVDGEKSVCVPVLALAERIDEAELAPEALRRAASGSGAARS